MKKSFLFAIITLLLVSPTCFAYKISTSGKTITLKMKHPSVGIVGLNAVGWEDDPNEIQKDIYDLFRGPLDSQKKGDYTVAVYWVGKDYYGHYSESYAGSFTISADELKRYKDYASAKWYLSIEQKLYKLAFGNRRF